MRTCTISNAKIVEGGGGPGTYACLGNPCVHFPRRCRTERLEALALCTWVIYKYKSCEHSHAVCCFSALFLPFGGVFMTSSWSLRRSSFLTCLAELAERALTVGVIALPRVALRGRFQKTEENNHPAVFFCGF